MGKGKLDLSTPLAVTGVATGVDKNGAEWWANATFVGQDFIVPKHWFDRVHEMPGCCIKLDSFGCKISECSTRQVDADLIAVRPKTAFTPKRKANARAPESEEVYLVAFADPRDAAPAVSSGQCAVSKSGVATYTASSKTGDCGGGVWAVKNNTTHLVGFHIYGDVTNNGFVAISKELMDRISGSAVFQPSLL